MQSHGGAALPVRKQSFLEGAIILTAATIVVKIIGMLYKIPLGNILGAVGMSYFMTAYNIFNPIYALSVAGFPVAVSKMVSESMAKRQYREAKKIFQSSFVLFILTGIAGFALMFFGADTAAALVDNPDAGLAIRAMAPAVLFCCVISAYRGYYQGLGNMTPTAVSQVLESIFKLVCGILFATLLLNRAMEGFESGSLVFGHEAMTKGQAELLALPWAAAGAILGVTAGSAVSSAYLALRHALKGEGISRDMLSVSAPPSKTTVIIKKLSWLALPVCIGSALTQVTALIDVATIMNRVAAAFSNNSEALLSIYRNVIPEVIKNEDIPRFLYGAFSYCSSLFHLTPALTIPLGISALPLISSHWALGNRRAAANQVQSVIKLSALLAIPAGLGLSALAGPILELLYPARISETVIAAPILQSLGIAAIFLGITAPVTSLFQALGRADIPVKLMALGAALKLGMNYFLLAVPEININAAAYGTILCYLFIFLSSVMLLQNILGMQINLINSFFKPLICGIICAVSANISYHALGKLIESRILCLISIVIGGTIYLFFVMVLKIITKNEVLFLPGGKKIAKILEKLSFLG